MLRYVAGVVALGLASWYAFGRKGSGPPAKLDDFEFMGTPDVSATTKPAKGDIVTVYVTGTAYAKEQLKKANDIFTAAEPDMMALQSLFVTFQATSARVKAAFVGMASGTLPGINPMGPDGKPMPNGPIQYAIVQVTAVEKASAGVGTPKVGDYVAIMA
jgi:hypothetical protein